MRERRPSGFTLIEAMVSMAILGILASVAIPSFRDMQLRSKAAERTYIMTAIQRAVDDIWIRDERFPTDLGGGSYLDLTNDQPNDTPGTTKTAWRIGGSDHWSRLSLTVEGEVYYRYGGWAIATPGMRHHFLYAYGDLDGDGVQNRWEKHHLWVNGVKQRSSGSTLDCADCTVAYQHNGWSF